MTTQQAPQRVYVSFSAGIDQNSTESLIALMAKYATQGIGEVYLMMSTLGGQVINGINLYHALRAMPFKLITHNVGSINSIGNAIFLAGEERYASPHTTFMFHGVGVTAQAGTRLESKMLRERLDAIDADERRIAAIIQERTQITDEEAAELFLEAKTKDTAYAVARGIVHDIREIKIPAGSPVVALAFQRQGQ